MNRVTPKRVQDALAATGMAACRGLYRRYDLPSADPATAGSVVCAMCPLFACAWHESPEFRDRHGDERHNTTPGELAHTLGLDGGYVTGFIARIDASAKPGVKINKLFEGDPEYVAGWGDGGEVAAVVFTGHTAPANHPDEEAPADDLGTG